MNKLVKAEAEIKRAIAKKCTCYVLITCTEPSESGHMDIEMKYEGDESLAAFLIDNASQVFEDRVQQKESR